MGGELIFIVGEGGPPYGGGTLFGEGEWTPEDTLIVMSSFIAASSASEIVYWEVPL